MTGVPSSELDVRSISASRWRLLSDFTRVTRDGRSFTVHAGDTTDFASVPFWTQSLLPKTGTWTKASVTHDKRCDLLNAVYKGGGEARDFFGWYRARCPDRGWRWVAPPGWFDSNDTDRVFREDARDDGTDPIRAELLWLGVRLGALANPARRAGWWRTAPRVLADLVAVLSVLVVVVTGLSWAWPW